ncbi:MAG TPA: phosphoribosylanthranilate isomerase [Thermoanaerobaculia bacterium]|nr:phosphoribosylanthranilate isomerase [Thermoanaerobaculia bacterium]
MSLPAGLAPARPRVKICGLTSLRDALMAASLGADALGFLVGLSYDAEDELRPDRAGSIITALPPFVTSVMVTHQVEVDQVVGLWRKVRSQSIQLHGSFPAPEIPTLRRELPGIKILKSVQVEDESSIEAAYRAAFFTDALVLDSRTPDRLVGTGTTHDWSVSRRIVEKVAPYPVILAGGLNPENVAQAQREVSPWGLDVNTGVSEKPGVKSRGLIESFLREANRLA